MLQNLPAAASVPVHAALHLLRFGQSMQQQMCWAEHCCWLVQVLRLQLHASASRTLQR